MAKEETKLENALKRLNAKKESYFSRIQTLHDMIPNLESDERAQKHFLLSSHTIDRSKFEAILDDINDLQLEMNPQFLPNYQPLDAFDELHAYIEMAKEKLQAGTNGTTLLQPTSSNATKAQHCCGHFKGHTNLPPLEIKPFCGDIRDWQRYEAIFVSVIVHNTRLTNVEKLHYLMSTVKNRPAELIKNFPLADDQFDAAWKRLIDEYSSSRVLASHFIEELVKPSDIPAKPTLESLQRFLSKTSDNVKGLQKMNLDNLSDFLFFSLSIRQLDPVTRREFESKNRQDSIPSFDKLIEFVKSECRLLEVTNPSVSLSVSKKSSSELPRTAACPKASTRKTALTTQVEPEKTNNSTKRWSSSSTIKTPPYNNRLRCIRCNSPHHLYHCPQYLKMSVPERHTFIKANHLCFNCLGSHHIAQCRSTRNCSCNQRHHSSLHFERPQVDQPAVRHPISDNPEPASQASSTQPQTKPATVLTANSSPATTFTCLSQPATLEPTKPRGSVVLLGTARAMIKNSKGQFIQFRLLIDSASTASFLTKDLVERLGLPILPCNMTVSGLSDNSVGSCSGIVDYKIKPTHATHPQITARALVVDTILSHVPQVSLPDSCKRFVQGLHLADPEFYRSSPVDMLLGCDVLPKILSAVSVPPHHSEIGVLPTVFGHVIIGSIPFNYSDIQNSTTTLCTYSHQPLQSATDDDLHKSIERFFEVENIIVPPSTDPSEDFCEKHFIETHRRTSEGRYIVQLPFACDPAHLEFPESKDVALKRFYSLENRFRKNPLLKEDCVKFMNQYKSMGHMIKSTRPGKYFIPFFCVFNPNSVTTPTRVVFDGSAKHSHVALNEVLLPGAKLQNDVPDVLLNFRIHPLVFCCDVSKMYRQIQVDAEHCSFMHILFRENPDEPLEEYELRTVTYGLSPSSFLAHRVLKQLTRDEGKNYPLACSVVLDSSVVDDYLVGCDTLDQLLEVKRQLTCLLSAGGFPLNKWLSNSPEFIANLQSSDSSGSLVIRNMDDHTIKVLGIGWDPTLDAFFFSIAPPPTEPSYTKRKVLSTVARIYDPLGFAAPVIFLFKCFLKELWLLGLGWDQPIPSSLALQWSQCISELTTLCDLKIPRCLFSNSPTSCHILGFSDASLKGSAAAIYLRVEFSNCSTKVYLLKSKTRVAPNKPQTVPRLELIGALLLSQLLNSIRPFINKLKVHNDNIFLFSDSTVVLSWIRKPLHLLKMFVSNRVSAILEHTLTSQWSYISTDNNISDIASRGLTPQALVNCTSWFNGPEWTYLPPVDWPLLHFDPITSDSLPECITASKSILVTSTHCPSEPPSWSEVSSNLSKLQRIMVYVLRFIHNARFPNNRISSPVVPLVPDLNLALKSCIKGEQAFYFKEDLKLLVLKKPCSNKIQSLSPFVDNTGLLRVGGRLENSALNFDSKHPILLSNKSSFTLLLIRYYHKLYLHSGYRTLQAVLSRDYWIINSRQVIRKVIHSCTTCARFRGSVFTPPMGNLPTPRVHPNEPFNHCAVDLAGPYTLKESLRRNARTYKGYFALFICCAIKAVHIEVLAGLSSDCFIAAFTRFTSRRGKPAHIYCDQATNFRGASRQLSDIVTFLRSSADNKILEQYFSSQGTSFHFSVPRAPFMNGLAESNIKNTKFHLYRAVGSQVLTFEEFSTITARVEAVLNSRPLCINNSSPDEIQSLTPGHFLIGRPLVAVPEDNLEHLPLNHLDRWQLVTQISQSLWRRWEKEYLHTLQNKAKWFEPAGNASVGQIVWLREDNSPPLSYPLGRIVQVHPGTDGVVRAASVRTSTGTYRRPVRKLAPLPVS